jgi:DNA-binding NtrC family response regulator
MEALQPHILIVDDASNWRTALETLLKSYGYKVTTAANVLEASEFLCRGPYAAAILDVRLDAFDDDNHEGVSTVLATAHQRYPQMGFIVISSYFNETDVRGFAPREAQLFYFDKNNFSIDKLLNTLREIIQ